MQVTSVKFQTVVPSKILSHFCMCRRSLAVTTVTDVNFISAKNLLPLYSSGKAVEKRDVLVLVIFD